MSERRRHRRVRAPGVAAHLHTGGETSSVLIENLSAGGIFLRTARPLEVGGLVTIDLVKPGLKRAITLSGQVVAAVSPQEATEKGVAPGMAVRFDALGSGSNERFQALLESLGGKSEPGSAPAAWPPRPAVVKVSAPAPVLTSPAPVAVELRMPAPGASGPKETERLMNHIRGLLKQLAESEERGRELEDKVRLLEELLEQKDRIIGRLMAARE